MLDKLAQSKRMLDQGKNLEKKFKQGLIQKFTWIYDLDRRFPGLRLYERLLGPRENDDHLNIRLLTKELLWQLEMESNPDYLGGVNLTESDIEAALSRLGYRAKIMPFASIQGLMKTCQVNIISDVCLAILNNDVSHIKKWLPLAARLNRIKP